MNAKSTVSDATESVLDESRGIVKVLPKVSFFSLADACRFLKIDIDKLKEKLDDHIKISQHRDQCVYTIEQSPIAKTA